MDGMEESRWMDKGVWHAHTQCRKHIATAMKGHVGEWLALSNCKFLRHHSERGVKLPRFKMMSSRQISARGRKSKHNLLPGCMHAHLVCSLLCPNQSRCSAVRPSAAILPVCIQHHQRGPESPRRRQGLGVRNHAPPPMRTSQRAHGNVSSIHVLLSQQNTASCCCRNAE